jgi:phosphoribosyl-AMP cyclohydrolase
MVAWMDEAALRATLTNQRGTYFSRSRGRQWVKGETSGNTQRVLGVHLDCDADAILVQVDQHGPACHTGEHSCFDVEGHQSGTAGTDGR